MSSLALNLPSFYYIESITSDNLYLNFNEGGPELTAQLQTGDYTMEGLEPVISEAMNAAGALTYTVTFLRTERKFQISATGSFSLLLTSGTNFGSSVFSLIGFSGADTALATTHTGINQAGSEYIPQFELQSYTDKEDFQKALYASINKSANGLIEVVKFGTEKFYEFNITFATNIEQVSDSAIRNNPTGLQDLRSFMRFCITKNNLEFMPDKNDKDTFYTVLLDKTDADQNGTGYQLKELYTKNLPGFFETGELRFRLVEE
jgi:hypothetical protein